MLREIGGNSMLLEGGIVACNAQQGFNDKRHCISNLFRFASISRDFPDLSSKCTLMFHHLKRDAKLIALERLAFLSDSILR